MNDINNMKKTQINILCLHGCNQTQEIFEGLTKQFRSIATTYSKTQNCDINFYYIEAQYDHSLGGKTWYNVELNVNKIGVIEYEENVVRDTLEMLDKKIKELNINVLLGFSQGGNVIDTYLTHVENNIKCAVIFSGYNLIDPNRNLKCETHVMNVCSDIDTIVPIKFMPIYKNMEIKYHNKGHKLPTSKPYIREIINYVYEKSK